MKIKHSSARKIRGRRPSDTFQVSIVNFQTPSNAPSISDVTDRDVVNTVTTGTFADNNFSLSISGAINSSFSITNQTPTIGQLTGTTVTRLLDGQVSLLLSDGNVKRIIKANVSRNTSVSNTSVFKNYTAGSLPKALSDSIDALISGKTASNAIQNVTSATNWTTAFTRNASLFLAGVNMTAFALSTGSNTDTAGVGQQSATVISPRHVVSAWHHRPPRVYWLASDGSIVFRNIASWQQVGTTDIAIGYVNTDIPATVTPIKVLPATWLNYMPHYNADLPVIYLDSGDDATGSSQPHRRAAIGQMDLIGTFTVSSVTNPAMIIDQPTKATRLAFWNTSASPQILFRSGSPIFVVNGTTPILLGCWHAASGSTYAIFPFLSNYIAEINAAMTALHGSTQYQLQTVDLSAFPTY